jgi:transposase
MIGKHAEKLRDILAHLDAATTSSDMDSAVYGCIRSGVGGRTQDGRILRHYRRRWKVEHLFAWLHNFRRTVIRWEYYPENFLGMVQLACAILLLRHL